MRELVGTHRCIQEFINIMKNRLSPELLHGYPVWSHHFYSFRFAFRSTVDPEVKACIFICNPTQSFYFSISLSLFKLSRLPTQPMESYRSIVLPTGRTE